MKIKIPSFFFNPSREQWSKNEKVGTNLIIITINRKYWKWGSSLISVKTFIYFYSILTF